MTDIDQAYRLDEVTLIDARGAAAPGDVSKTWWYAEVKAGRAPQPVIRGHRFTRWRLSDVKAFWESRIAQGSLSGGGGETVALATKASRAAQAKRAVSQVQS